MARKRIAAVEDAQIQLMEVDHPVTKKFKALRRKLEAANDKKNEGAAEGKIVRRDIIALLREAGFKPDMDGVIRIELDGGIVEISQGESKLTFKEKPKVIAAASDEGEGEDASD